MEAATSRSQKGGSVTRYSATSCVGGVMDASVSIVLKALFFEEINFTDKGYIWYNYYRIHKTTGKCFTGLNFRGS